MDSADPGETWYFFQNYSMKKLKLLRPFSLFYRRSRHLKMASLLMRLHHNESLAGKNTFIKCTSKERNSLRYVYVITGENDNT